MRRVTALLAIVSLLLTSCDGLARSELSLEFNETGEFVNVRVSSDEKHLKMYHSEDRSRLGDDVIAARDEWSLRFAAANAESENIVINRKKREVTDLVQSGRIRSDQLHRFFQDVGVVVDVRRSEQTMELNLYPGASNRATRQQRAEVDRTLRDFARSTVRYYDALRAMYAHLDANEKRAPELFLALFHKEGEEPVLTEREKALVDAVEAAMTNVYSASDGEESNLARLADLAYNPFPAVARVKVAGEILSVEGFEAGEEANVLEASTRTPVEALAKLEGRWASPDPLSQILLHDDLQLSQAAVAEIAAMPRNIEAAVTEAEVIEAVTAGIRPAARYHVRWTVKPVQRTVAGN